MEPIDIIMIVIPTTMLTKEGVAHKYMKETNPIKNINESPIIMLI